MRSLKELDETNFKLLVPAKDYDNEVIKLVYKLLNYCFNTKQFIFDIFNDNRDYVISLEDLNKYSCLKRDNIQEIKKDLITVISSYIRLIAEEQDVGISHAEYEKTGRYILVTRDQLVDLMPRVIFNKLQEIYDKFYKEELENYLKFINIIKEEYLKKELNLNNKTSTNLAILNNII